MHLAGFRTCIFSMSMEVLDALRPLALNTRVWLRFRLSDKREPSLQVTQ